jgi:hypothetical protein
MPKLDIVVAHRLTQAEAEKRIRNMLDDLKTRHAGQMSGYREEWDDCCGKIRFSSMGFTVSGTLKVKQSQVEISGGLPLAAVFLKGKIQAAIENEMKTLLA